MTRINVVPVEELSTQHLLAEYREISRVSALAKKDVAPAEYVLGKGHVKFFYDKGEWLRKRFEDEIVPELKKRGINARYSTYRPHPPELNNNWVPNEAALALNRKRIKERIDGRKRKS